MTQSWIIIDTLTGKPVLETWNPELVAKLRPRYKAVAALEYLVSINGRKVA